MIHIIEGCEYTTLIANLIETLSALDSKGIFELKIWLIGTPTPFEFDNTCEFDFANEGVRIINSYGEIYYIFYDRFDCIKISIQEVKSE